MLLTICLQPSMITHFPVTSLEAVVPKINIYLLFLPYKFLEQKAINRIFLSELESACYIALKFFQKSSPKEGT